eukprot:scpid110306/ scgid6926/ 
MASVEQTRGVNDARNSSLTWPYFFFLLSAAFRATVSQDDRPGSWVHQQQRCGCRTMQLPPGYLPRHPGLTNQLAGCSDHPPEREQTQHGHHQTLPGRVWYLYFVFVFNIILWILHR